MHLQLLLNAQLLSLLDVKLLLSMDAQHTSIIIFRRAATSTYKRTMHTYYYCWTHAYYHNNIIIIARLVQHVPFITIGTIIIIAIESSLIITNKITAAIIWLLIFRQLNMVTIDRIYVSCLVGFFELEFLANLYSPGSRRRPTLSVDMNFKIDTRSNEFGLKKWVVHSIYNT